MGEKQCRSTQQLLFRHHDQHMMPIELCAIAPHALGSAAPVKAYCVAAHWAPFAQEKIATQQKGLRKVSNLSMAGLKLVVKRTS